MSTCVTALSAADLAERWQLSPSTVISYWRRGDIPAPMNPTAPRRFRWSLAVIEEFERTNGKTAEVAQDGAA